MNFVAADKDRTDLTCEATVKLPRSRNCSVCLDVYCECYAFEFRAYLVKKGKA